MLMIFLMSLFKYLFLDSFTSVVGQSLVGHIESVKTK